jgi:hypothetical protein
MNHGDTEVTEKSFYKIFLCVLRASVVIFIKHAFPIY